MQTRNHHLQMAFSHPTHLSALAPPKYEPIHLLRSADQNFLALPTLTFEFGRRAFSYFAPSSWNDLPLAVRSVETLASFKSQLETSTHVYS